jgi:hypothetical protein
MAVETSTKQMALTRNSAFMERVQAMLAQATSGVLSEPGDTPYHLFRAQYAQRVVQNPAGAAFQAGPQVVMGVNVINTTTYDEVNKTAECAIADIDLQSQIATLWNSLGGIDTPS